MRADWQRDYDLDDPTDADARARAKHKLAAIRTGTVVLSPAGRYWGRFVGGLFVLILAGGAFFGAYAFAGRGDEGSTYVAWVLAGVGALLLMPAFRMMAGSRATTPFRALNLFYRLLASGAHKTARRFVAENDFDHFPREFPSIPAVKGDPGAEWLHFDERGDFRAYWDALMRWPTAPYCIARVRGLTVEELAPDVVRCDFTLRLGVGSQLWFLAIFLGPGLLIALILDAATRTNFRRGMSKVLIRVDDEWKLFNGAWYEADDENPSWV